MNQPANIDSSLVLICTLLSFYLYYYLAHSKVTEKWVIMHTRPNSYPIILFLTRKILGVFFLGIVPGIGYFLVLKCDIQQFGLSFQDLKANFSLFIILVPIILLLVFLNQKISPSKNSLQIDKKNWTISLFLINAMAWIIYLTAYEFLFRGILLFEYYKAHGFWPAIAVNVVIYSAIHMVNGKQQAIGALFFGLIVSYYTLSRETLLIPIIMHTILSLGSDFFTLKMNSNFTLSLKL